MSEFPRFLETENINVSPWYKSSLSHANGNCVEIADLADGHVGMRHSKDVTGPVLKIDRAAWKELLGGIKKGELGF